MTAPLTREQAALRLQEVVAFLCGEKPLDDKWFGSPPHAPQYWWRKELRDLIAVVLPAPSAEPASVEQEWFVGYLCYAYGESDLPAARLCRSFAEVRAFMVDEWFGDPKDPELDGLMKELNDRDWSDEPWKVEFEIGGVKIEKVGAWQARAAAPASPNR